MTTLICFLIITTCCAPKIVAMKFNLAQIGLDNHDKDILTDGEGTFISKEGVQFTCQNQTRAGRATYVHPLHLWDAVSRQMADFTTNISFVMDSRNASWAIYGAIYGDVGLPGGFPFAAVKFDSSDMHHDESDIEMSEDSAELVAYNSSHVIIIVVSVCVTLTCIFLLISYLYNYLCMKKRLNDGEENHNEHQGSTGTTFELCSPRPFTFEELACATNNFHQDQILGKGGFGAVYKAVFPNGQTAAVKRVSSTSQQGIKEYTAEVMIVCRSNHRHLVQLIGWCHEISGELLLVYELMENKSLDVHLFDPKMDSLAWSVRYKIAQGLAKALLYLHEECGQHSVLHLDTKSSNVLLDSKFEPKLGDFGLAKLVDHDKSMELSVMAGTRGYLAPECVLTGKVSTHSDVYSFGVVALELATGRKTIDPSAEEDQKVLVKWVQNLYKAGRVMEAVDPKLGNDYNEVQVKGLLIVGLWCVLHDFRERPSMREIVHILNNKEDPLLDLHGKIPSLIRDPVPFDFDSIRETSFGSSDLILPMEMENPIPVDPMVLSSGDTVGSEDEDQTYSTLFMWRHISVLHLWRYLIDVMWFRSSHNG